MESIIQDFAMPAEALNVLWLLEFHETVDYARNNNSCLADNLDEIQLQISQHFYDKDSIKATKLVWHDCLRNEASTRLRENFEDFVTGKSCSVTFKILSIFIDDMYPIFQNLTRSFKVADFDLHLTAVRKSLLLFFSFDHYNYTRWVPLYFED